jgi:methionyl-tRNA formyltransferase
LNIAVIGGVGSTDVLVRKLHEHGFQSLHLWGYEPAQTELVSGWADLRSTAGELGIGYSGFRKVASCEEELRQFGPDFLFAVGLSQLIPPSMLSIARTENVGFHPTALPRGRGRAAIAWLILNREPGAATFFAIREGVDDGPIFVQEPFEVADEDDASSIYTRVLEAEAEALDRWLPALAAGKVDAVPQDESAATWYGKRNPEDGWIDWAQPAENVIRLIRASTDPHPGTWTLFEDIRLSLSAAERDDRPETGVVGRILRVQSDQFVVQSGSGLVRVTKWSADRPWAPRVGMKLGYYAEAEILRLRERCARFEERLAAAEETIKRLRP